MAYTGPIFTVHVKPWYTKRVHMYAPNVQARNNHTHENGPAGRSRRFF